MASLLCRLPGNGRIAEQIELGLITFQSAAADISLVEQTVQIVVNAVANLRFGISRWAFATKLRAAEDFVLSLSITPQGPKIVIPDLLGVGFIVHHETKFIEITPGAAPDGAGIEILGTR